MSFFKNNPVSFSLYNTYLTSKHDVRLRTVKDKYLQAKAVSFCQKVNIQDLKCSSGGIHKFKNIYNLVSRTHTSCGTIPENAKSLATDFIYAARNLIKHN
ncbi:hypothetical protein NGRA_2015 [Nosema granulosis]|uniref:Uncharacterized protein n=1 Tax=Nosema granulosis TaxID=83296 RepID=A0A9P6GYX4_9MICR|nr:hypothetical protein NGRA_2015 [Nosema granulosis]